MRGFVDEWQFGGLLRGLPPGAAWAILGALALIGAVLIAKSYQNTLRHIPSTARISLTVLRTAVMLALLCCLANPQRPQNDRDKPPARNTLTMLVDQSDSMTTADHRSQTRLAAATRLWKRHEKDVEKTFGGIRAYRFAGTVREARSPDEAIPPAETGSGETRQTRLYPAILEALTRSPAAILCLTDGIDTTGEDPGTLVATAQREGVPIYFAVGKNRSQAAEMLNIREIKAPSEVLRRSQFNLSVLIEATMPKDGEVPLELWSGGEKLAATSLSLRRGRSAISWPATVTSTEPGMMRLEFRLGLGDLRQVAHCTTRVVDKRKIDVLYYQGALQWGYRYLLSALQADPSFHLESILNPALGVQLSTGGGSGNNLMDLPATAKELKRFQIIILAHVFADRLSPDRQKALIEYVRGGGAVLFIAPDSHAAQGFSGTPIEGMLPVVFDSRRLVESSAELEKKFRQQMLFAGGLYGADPSSIDPTQSLASLESFVFPPGPLRSAPVLRGIDADNLPKFSQYAKVSALKPGGEILAVRQPTPQDRNADILLARQQFGEGFTAFLATDLLWRWKMSLPSTSRAVDVFWQQLLLSLTPDPGKGLRVAAPTEVPALGSATTIRVEGPSSLPAPTATAVSPGGTSLPLLLQHVPGTEGGSWTATFNPDKPGIWSVTASDSSGSDAGVQFAVSENSRTTEDPGIPPDIEGLRRIAEATGGTLIGDDPVFKTRTDLGREWQIKRPAPLWNTYWLLGLLLGLYAAELVVRRKFNLL